MSERTGYGYFDEIVDAFAIGWAYSEGVEPAVVEVFTDDGRIFARGVAGLPRPDVEAARAVPPGTACGFRLGLDRQMGKTNKSIALRVRLVDGPELQGGPVVWKPHCRKAVRGYFDTIRGFFAEGWAAGASGETLRVVLLIDGRSVVTVPADRFRADLRDARIGNGCHAFRIALPPALAQTGGTVSILAEGQPKPLPGSPIYVPPPGSTQDRMAIDGALERIDGRYVSGWVLDGRRPAQARLLHIRVNFELVLVTVASPTPEGYCRFDCTFDSTSFVSDTDVISVQDAESGLFLNNASVSRDPTRDPGPSFLNRLFTDLEATAVAEGPERASAQAELAAMVMDAGDQVVEHPIGIYFDARYGLIKRLRILGQLAAADRLEAALIATLVRLGSTAVDRLDTLCNLSLGNPESRAALAIWLDMLPEQIQSQPAAVRLNLRVIAAAHRDTIGVIDRLAGCDPATLIDEADRLVTLGTPRLAARLYSLAAAKAPLCDE